MNKMDGGGWVGWIKLLSLKSLKRKPSETTLTFIRWAWIRLVHLYQHVSCLVRSHETLAAKHPQIKTTSILTTLLSEQYVLGTVLFAKQEIVYFLFKGVPTGHTYSCCWEGKARGTVGHSAMFFLETSLGQCNCMIHFKEAPWEDRGCKTGKRQSRSVHARTRLSITALTQWRQEQSQKQAGPQRH